MLMTIFYGTKAQRGNETFNPLRVHYFQRTQGQVGVCSNPNCSGKHHALENDANWKWGKITPNGKKIVTLVNKMALHLRCMNWYSKIISGTDYIRGNFAPPLFQPNSVAGNRYRSC